MTFMNGAGGSRQFLHALFGLPMIFDTYRPDLAYMAAHVFSGGGLVMLIWLQISRLR